MNEVFLTIRIDGDGSPLRVSADPGEMTPEQRDTYESLYGAYKAEKHAFWHWFDLRQRFFSRRGPDKIAVERQAHWSHVADETTLRLQEVVH